MFQSSHTSPRKTLGIFACFVFLLFGLTNFANALPSGMPGGFFVEELLTGTGAPTDLAFVNPSTILIVMKTGQVMVCRVQGGKWVMNPNPILDLSKKIGSAYGDRGLSSIAVDPFFSQGQPYIYLTYVQDLNPQNVLAPARSMISRFTVNGDASWVDPNSEWVMVGACTRMEGGWYGGDCLPNNGTAHAANQIRIGPDNHLWVTVGDMIKYEGADWTGNQAWAAPLDPNIMAGKLLRIDRITGNGLPDNPFYDGNVQSARSKVWSVGLRNPWAGSFTRKQEINPKAWPPEMLIGDVGWYTYERAVRLLPGNSAGWPCYEGNVAAPFPNSNFSACQSYYAGTSGWPAYDVTSVPLVDPHYGNSAALIGGVFFTSAFPAPYRDCWIYADFSLNTINCLPWDSVNGKVSGQPLPIAQSADAPTRFVQSPIDNCVYYIAFCTNCYQYGNIRRICYGGLPSLGGGGAPPPPPPPPAPGCLPPNPIVLPPLPAGWQTIMYASAMNSVGAYTPTQNNNVQCQSAGCNVEIDSSAGDPWKVMDGNPFSIGGRRFAKGFGATVTSELHINIAKRCFRFTSSIGVDDDTPWALQNSKFPGGEFIVRLDGAINFNSTDSFGRPLVRGDYMEMGVNLLQVADLALLGWSPKGNMNPYSGFHLDWADARLFCGPDAPYLPQLKWIAPQDRTQVFRPGQQVYFQATATDWQGNVLPNSQYKFDLNVIHGQGAINHIHPGIVRWTNVDRGTFTIEAHTNNPVEYYYYEIRFTATDYCGRSNFISWYVVAKA